MQRVRSALSIAVCSSLIGGVSTVSPLPAIASAQLPTIAAEGAKASDFVPAGWKVFKHAEGDLNGDGKPDNAMILVKGDDNPESGSLDTGFSRELRPLVVLLDQGGRLKRAAVSAGAVMNGQVANNFALLAVDLVIARGNLIVTNGNGATSICNFDSTYRLQNGKFELIGVTEAGGNTREGYSMTTDSNLNTGFTQVTSATGVSMETGDARHSDQSEFYALRAGLAQGGAEPAPVVDGALSKGEYPGPAVVLKQKKNVVTGVPLWHSALDLNAKIHGVHTKTDLFVCAEVTHKSGQKPCFVRLAAPKKYLSPAKIVVTPTATGEIVEASFPLAQLKPFADSANGYVPVGYSAINLSVQIVQPNQSGSSGLVISTSCDREKSKGEIKLTRTPELPTLESWDWAHPDH